ncbi:MAG: hypothetical protein Aurels2KO_17120 [Aureliella sp.]
MKNSFSVWCSNLLFVSACLGLVGTANSAEVARVKHAGPMAFGPDGVLLIGDSLSAAVFAVETGDVASDRRAVAPNVDAINQAIADMVGSSLKETMVNDMIVNPANGRVYMSVSQGRGPDAQPALFRTTFDGQLELVDLDKAKTSLAKFENAPESRQTRRGNPRMSAITDIQFSDNKVIVAGLSNEEFASKLRVFNFPFESGAGSSTSIEIYHGAHGALETRSPVQTFVTYENSVLAAYTCTPLVTIPIDELSGQKTTGKTIAELGNRNKPLDMIVYTKGDDDYLLMSNSARGVMKMKIDQSEFEATESIKSRISGTAGIAYETIESMTNVKQLDKLDAQHAVLLVENEDATLDLKTVALP